MGFPSPITIEPIRTARVGLRGSSIVSPEEFSSFILTNRRGFGNVTERVTIEPFLSWLFLGSLPDVRRGQSLLLPSRGGTFALGPAGPHPHPLFDSCGRRNLRSLGLCRLVDGVVGRGGSAYVRGKANMS